MLAMEHQFDARTIKGIPMRKLLFLASLFCWSGFVLADVYVAVENDVPVDTLQQIAKSIGFAAARPTEQQEFTAYYSIAPTIMLSCGAHLPDTQGNGCILFFSPKTQAQKGEIGFSISKPVVKSILISAVETAKKKTAETDPNMTEEHLHFGNPLYNPSNQADGTHYFCAPEGPAGQKIWKCYLDAAETLSAKANLR